MSKVWHQCLILDPCVQNQTLIIYCNKVRIERALSLVKRACSMRVYIISSVMYAFWLVLTYDLLEDRCIDDVIIKTFFNSLLYKTNRFQVAVRLFSNRSQRTSKCGKNISDTFGCALWAPFLFLPHFDVSVIYYWTIVMMMWTFFSMTLALKIKSTSVKNRMLVSDIAHYCKKLNTYIQMIDHKLSWW